MKYAILIAALALFSCKSSKNVDIDEPVYYEAATGFQFVQDAPLTQVVDLAKEQDKLVFLDIYTDWCLPCQIMNEEVFNDERLGEYFKSEFISFKVNAEKGYGPNIATLYEVKGYPTLLFLDQSGRILEQKSGMAYHRELKQMAEQAIRVNNQNGTSE